MSKTIDEKVVSMQFDNKNFEANVKTTMSTIDKLKQSLNLNDAAKGLENIDKAANNVNMSGLSSAVETVQAKFSSLDVIAITALSNITNSAINAGKRMIKALTIDPVSQGYDEYELKMSSIQTIMASTGASLEEVNKYLDELNTYADKTIYSFSDMTNNIGKFTNAGVKLDDAVKAIQGVSNEAAVSGANANEASRAMYNFAQALSAGYVKLIDWKSIENANMATVEFKNNLIQTALEMGTLTKVGDKYKTTTKDLNGKVSEAFTATSNFNESLAHQWMTTDVLVKTLGDYADETTEIGKKAFAAAQDVKTFSQLMDTLKEAVGSGWARTFEIIFGDFEQAKALWTSVNNVLSPIIDAFSNARNNLLDGAFNGTPLQKLAKKLETIIKPAKDVAEATNKVTNAMKDYNKIVNKVIVGDYGNGKSRWEKLSKEGYDWAKVQNLVNKELKSNVRHTEQLTDAQKKSSKVQKESTETQAKTIEQLAAMSDKELKNLGLTEEEIQAFKELEEQSKKTGIPIKELIENIDQLDGRTLLAKSFQNIGSSIAKIFTAIGAAWKDAFPASSTNILYEIIAGFHKFSTYLKFSDNAANDLTRTLKGVFAILDIVTSILGGGFKIAFGIGTKVLSEFWKALGLANVNILKVTANIGDAIVAFRNWWEEHSIVNKAIETMVPLLVKAAKAVYDWAKSIYELPEVQSNLSNVAEGFKNIGEAIEKYFSGGLDRIKEFIDRIKSMDGLTLDNFKAAVKDFKDNVLDYFFDFDGLLDKIPDNILDGLVNGLKNGGSKVKEAIANIGEIILYTIKTLLGIHSPSTEFESIGKNVIAGLCQGIQNGLSALIEVLKTIVSTLFSAFKGIDLTDIFIMGSTVGLGLLGKKFVDILDKITNPLEKIGEVFDGVKGVLKSTSKVIDAKTKNIKSESLLNIAKAIGILAISLVALSLVDQQNLWSAVGALAAITAAMVALLKVTEKMDNISGFGKVSVLMLGISASLLIVSLALKKLASIEPGRAAIALGEMVVILGGLSAVLYAYGKFVTADASANIDKAGKMMLKMAIGIGILAVVLKLIAGIDSSDLTKGVIVIGAMTLLFAAITAISSIAGSNADKAGKMLSKMAMAIGVLALTIKLIATIDNGDILKGLIVITTISLLFGTIIAVSALAGKNADKAGKMILKMSVAIGILALTMKLVAGMSTSELLTGIAFLANVSLFFVAFMALSNVVNVDKADKIGSMLLKISVAIGILAIAIKLIAGMSMSDIIQGIGVIAAVTTMFVAFVYVSKYAGENADKAGTMLLKMSAAIAVMAVAVKIIGRLSVSDIAKGIAFMSGLGVFIAAMIAVSKYSGEYADKAGTMLLKMSAAILILVGAIALLSLLDPQEVAVGTACISALMGMMALLMYATKFVPEKLSVNLIALTVAIGLLGGIIYLVGSLPYESALGAAGALSILLLSLTASMVIIGNVKAVSQSALISMGVLVIIVGLLGGILYLLQDLPVDSSIATAKALSILLTSLSGCCLILSAAGSMPGAFTGIAAFITLIGAMGTLMTALGALTTYFPALEEFLDKGIGILKKIGYGLGSALGSIIAGFSEEVASSLPTIGIRLSEFMVNLTPFIMGIKMLDGSTTYAAKALAETILILTAADLLNSITSFITGGNSMTEFANQLKPFGEAMVSFSETVSGKIDESAVTAASNAGKMLSEMQASISGTGGVIQFFTGEKDLAKFGQQILLFGEAIVSFSETVAGNIDESAVTAAANAGKTMSELQSSLSNTGGVIQYFTGEKDMGKFGEQIVKFGDSMVDFSDAVSGNIDEDAVQSAANAGSIMSKLQNSLPTDKQWWQFWKDDKMDLSSFGENLKDFGGAINDFSGSIKDVDSSKITSISTGAVQLVNLIKQMDGIDSDSVKEFKDSINSLADTDISGFVKNFEGSSSKMFTVGSNITSSISKGMTSNQSSLKSTASSLVSDMAKAINSQSNAFVSAGTNFVKQFVSGISKGGLQITIVITGLLVSTLSAIRSQYDSFYSAGSYLVSGFANGISQNSYKAAAKAKAMAAAATSAAKRELDEHSPSKVFYGIGSYAVDGFVKAFGDNISKSYKAGSEIAETATSGLSNAISKISDAINSDMDTQPTIRPVVDLSNVTSSADAINGMFGMSPSVGVLSNVRAINSMMSKNQNDNNFEVVSAINKLGKKLDGVGTTVNNINGITYDDGSNITDAVEALVKAAIVERRK